MCRLINKFAFTEVSQDHNTLSSGLLNPLGLINRKIERNSIPQNVGKFWKSKKATFYRGEP